MKGKYTITRYYDNGKLESKTNFKDGKLDGLSIGWHGSGVCQKEEIYKDGVRQWGEHHQEGLVEWYKTEEERKA